MRPTNLAKQRENLQRGSRGLLWLWQGDRLLTEQRQSPSLQLTLHCASFTRTSTVSTEFSDTWLNTHTHMYIQAHVCLELPSQPTRSTISYVTVLCCCCYCCWPSLPTSLDGFRCWHCSFARPSRALFSQRNRYRKIWLRNTLLLCTSY